MIYDTSKVIDVLSLEEILKHTTEYDIYAYYLGSKFDVGKIMSSPFRQDLKPSFGIFKSSTSSALLWKDQATGETGNCITFVKKYKDLYRNSQALKLIWDEVVKGNLSISKRGREITEIYKSIKTIISVKRRNFCETDYVYWGGYNINRSVLDRYNVFPISYFWVNDTLQSLVYSKTQPMYAYKIFDKFKIYRPFAEKRSEKWRTNCSSIDLQGYEQLPETGDLLILTKSLKDVMVLYSLGYNAVALQSENDHLYKAIYTDLKGRFKRIIILFDNDVPGLDASFKLTKKYNLERTYIDSSYWSIYNIKDISDFVKVFPKSTGKMIKSLLRLKQSDLGHSDTSTGSLPLPEEIVPETGSKGPTTKN